MPIFKKIRRGEKSCHLWQLYETPPYHFLVFTVPGNIKVLTRLFLLMATILWVSTLISIKSEWTFFRLLENVMEN